MNKIRKLKTRIYCRNGIERDLEGQYIKYKEQKFQKKKEKKKKKGIHEGRVQNYPGIYLVKYQEENFQNEGHTEGEHNMI